MKPGDIVRYAIFPHEELHFSGMTGLVLSKPYVIKGHRGDIVTIDVMWSEKRNTGMSPLNIAWEYIDELEVVEK